MIFHINNAALIKVYLTIVDYKNFIFNYNLSFDNNFTYFNLFKVFITM